jgi:predicted RecB family nuclease
MAVVDEIFHRCLSGSLKGDLMARNVALYLTSPYMIYCEKFVDEGEKDPRSPYREILLERGIEHERRVIEKMYPGYRPPAYDGAEEGFRKLLEEMARGAPVICGLPLFHLPENLQGRIDVLERRDDHPSVFGDYHYAVKEIKLSRKIQPEHILQGAFYTYLAGKIQAYRPDIFSIINHDRWISNYRFAEHEENLRKALTGTQAILDGRESPTPTYNGSAWPWEKYTNHQALRSRDVSIVGQVGPKTKEKLAAAGYRKIWDVMGAQPEALAKIPGISETAARKIILSARAIHDGQPILLNPAALRFPERSMEIFLDLEGTDEPDLEGEEEPVDYLIGVLVRKGGRTFYRPFVAHRFHEEKDMFSAFLEFIRSESDYVIYHWHHYEMWHLRRLAKRHGFIDEAERFLFPHMIDLHRLATSALVFPTYSNGLKDVAAFLRHRWRHEDVNALDAIAWYLKYQNDPEGYRERMKAVIDYNEDDCVATMRIRDWLQERSLETNPQASG